jgi:4-diphosphocytidyl-2-C-methyl-D-erythritol kinase
MALDLGSDVPFFLFGGAAWVTGRGERIRPLEVLPRVWVVLVNPGFSSGTAEAFALLDRCRREGLEPAAAVSEGAALAALGESPGFWPYGNDFLPVFMTGGSDRVKPVYDGMLGELRTLGADFAGLSGTGSSCFGIFLGKGAAEQAVKRLRKHWKFVQFTFPLARSVIRVLQ